MSIVQIYDVAMCCSTGVCGPQVDESLLQFASDLEWLRSNGHQIERYNLGQQPEEYTKNLTVKQLLESEGVECLPLVLIDGQVMSRSGYPTRENLATWTNTPLGLVIFPVVSNQTNDGCGSSGCC